jgi:hypothetical protein
VGYPGLAALNEKQYLQVCEVCDSVLLSPQASRETMGIPWLHVIREHPSFLKEYVELFAPSIAWLSFLKSVARLALNVAGWLRQAWRALRSDGEAWKASQTLNGPVDVLFVSHLLNHSDAGKATDFYFGDLPDLIRAEGSSVVVALIDHVGITDSSIVQRWAGNAGTRVLLARSLDFRGELSLFYRLRKESLRLAVMSKRQGSLLLGKVCARASQEAMAGGARTALRMSVQIGQLVATIKPKMMVVTYEGHAWERMVFAAARDAFPKVQCVGYQHAALFRMQHSALRKLGASFDPDLVFTAGNISKVQIENSKKLENIPVRILGSNRAVVHSPATCFPDSGSVHGIRHSVDSGNTCLVLPEGIISECLVLFEFSLNCAALMPQMRFVWRLHPLLSRARLVRSSSRMRTLPANVELSNLPLEDDLRYANYALYRGSTAIVQAVCAGLEPIYLSDKDEMSIDPLYGLDAGRVSVTSPLEFQSAIFDKKTTTSNVAVHNRQVAIRYCEDFYTRTEPEVLLSALNKTGTSL